jgi:hypoxanthine phosphoribosyltransferase
MRTSYDYAQRQGVDEIDWPRFAALAATLTEGLAAAGVQAVVGIARAGLFPATAAACALRCELHPVRVTRRVDDRVTYAHPRWKIDVPVKVQGQVVAVVDEIADTGETLALVAGRVRERGAARVVTAALVSHSWADPAPDLTSLVSDALIVFPWDRRVYQDGTWQLHPELAGALRLQERRLTGD